MRLKSYSGIGSHSVPQRLSSPSKVADSPSLGQIAVRREVGINLVREKRLELLRVFNPAGFESAVSACSTTLANMVLATRIELVRLALQARMRPIHQTRNKICREGSFRYALCYLLSLD